MDPPPPPHTHTHTHLEWDKEGLIYTSCCAFTRVYNSDTTEYRLFSLNYTLKSKVNQSWKQQGPQPTCFALFIRIWWYLKLELNHVDQFISVSVGHNSHSPHRTGFMGFLNQETDEIGASFLGHSYINSFSLNRKLLPCCRRYWEM